MRYIIRRRRTETLLPIKKKGKTFEEFSFEKQALHHCRKEALSFRDNRPVTHLLQPWKKRSGSQFTIRFTEKERETREFPTLNFTVVQSFPLSRRKARTPRTTIRFFPTFATPESSSSGVAVKFVRNNVARWKKKRDYISVLFLEHDWSCNERTSTVVAPACRWHEGENFPTRSAIAIYFSAPRLTRTCRDTHAWNFLEQVGAIVGDLRCTRAREQRSEHSKHDRE